MGLGGVIMSVNSYTSLHARSRGSSKGDMQNILRTVFPF